MNLRKLMFRAAPSLYLAGVIYPKVRAIPTAQRGWLLLVAALGFGMTNAELTYTVSYDINPRRHD